MSPATPAVEVEPRTSRSQARRRSLALVGAVAVIAFVFAVVLPRIADYGAVWSRVSTLSTGWEVALVAAAALNLLTFGPPWMAALPGLRFWRALMVTQASTALSNVMPGGDALGVATTYGMLRGWGFPRQSIALAAVVFSLWNQFVNVAFPVAAVVALAVSGEQLDLLGPAAAIGTLVLVTAVAGFALVLRGDRSAWRLGELAARVANVPLSWFDRPPREGWGEAVVDFRCEAIGLLRHRWPVLTAATVIGHLTVFAVLVVSLRAVGVSTDEVSLAEAFAAWSLLRLVTAVPLTPGGVGVVELGLTGALVGFGGPQVRVVAAVLIYRFLTFLPPIPVGAVCALLWSRRRTALLAGASR